MDPEYASACAGLAYSYAFLGGGAPVIPVEEAYEKTRTLAHKALDMDENLLEARITMGVVKMEWDWDFAGAEKAHYVDPLNGFVGWQHCRSLIWAGYYRKALVEIHKLEELFPESLFISMLRSKVYLKLG